MRTTASIQIGFKVSSDIAAKLEALGQPLRLSRSLVAKELVLAALAKETQPEGIELFKHRVLGEAVPANADGENDERTELDDLVQDLLGCLKAQNEFLDHLRVALRELAALRHEDMPALRSDIRTSVAALLCQSGASVEAAKEWVKKHLAVNTSES